MFCKQLQRFVEQNLLFEQQLGLASEIYVLLFYQTDAVRDMTVPSLVITVITSLLGPLFDCPFTSSDAGNVFVCSDEKSSP